MGRLPFFAPGQGDGGQELAEYAIVFPVLMLLLLGIIEFGVVIMRYNTIANAAREAVRYAIVPPHHPDIPASTLSETCDGAANAIVQTACNRALSLVPTEVTVSVIPEGDTYDGIAVPLDHVGIVVDFQAQLMTAPLISSVGGGGIIPLRAVSTMRLE